MEAVLRLSLYTGIVDMSKARKQDLSGASLAGVDLVCIPWLSPSLHPSRVRQESYLRRRILQTASSREGNASRKISGSVLRVDLV